MNGNYGFIDKNGKEIIPCNYDVARNFNEGLAAITLNVKWGFIEKSGREVTPFNYTLPEIIQKRKLISGMDLPVLN